MSTAWKDLERHVAKRLGGKRRHRGANFSESMPDIEHERFSCEVKHRKHLPRLLRLGLEQAADYDRAKVPLLIVKEKHQRGALAVLWLDDFANLVGGFSGEGGEEERHE
jgi:hypothetical protein